MNKKKIIAVVVVFIVLIGAVGYILIPQFFPTLEKKEHSHEHLIQEEFTVTPSGVKVGSLTEMNGAYTQVIDSSELYFYNGIEAGTSGKFNSFTVAMVADGTPENLQIKVSVSAGSLFTYSDMRDDHLKNEDFFNVESHPKIEFVSSSVELADSGYVANGIMNFMGVDHSVTIPFEYLGSSTYPDDGLAYHVLEGKIIFNPGNHGLKPDATIAEIVSATFYLEMVETK